MFEKVKRFYEMGLYSVENVAVFVEKGKLTAEQFEEITGQTYSGQ